jgi:hypothetical protein
LGWFNDFGFSSDVALYWNIAFSAIAAIMGGLLGAFLGWFNVVILFPREVKRSEQPPRL